MGTTFHNPHCSKDRDGDPPSGLPPTYGMGGWVGFNSLLPRSLGGASGRPKERKRENGKEQAEVRKSESERAGGVKREGGVIVAVSEIYISAGLF